MSKARGNDYSSSSMAKIQPQVANSEVENPTYHRSNNRNEKSRYNSVANLPAGLSRTPSAGVGSRPPRLRVNQFMKGVEESTPIPVPNPR
jgi:hypothetical protein